MPAQMLACLIHFWADEVHTTYLVKETKIRIGSHKLKQCQMVTTTSIIECLIQLGTMGTCLLFLLKSVLNSNYDYWSCALLT